MPIDNFITRSTETFLSNPTYLQQVRSPCSGPAYAQSKEHRQSAELFI